MIADSYARFQDVAGFDPDRPLGLAVSGGGDSLALLLQTREALPDIPLYCATVDHGLRAEAESEAAYVAKICAELGVRHWILQVNDLTKGPNLQARARRERYAALVKWANDEGLDQIALGHTLDDVAETFLMRLARGSGLDGLSAMPDHWRQEHVTFLRPLLQASRTDLRTYLQDAGVKWIEDPSNEDTSFDRVKVRQILPSLSEIGLTPQRIADAAQNLKSSKHVVDQQVSILFRACTTADGPDIVFDRAQLNAALPEVRNRLVARIAAWFGNAKYAPRFDQLKAAMQATSPRTLHGIIWSGTEAQLRLTREVSATTPSDGPNWDGRWWVHDLEPGHFIRALGEDGLKQCPDWRASGLPRRTLLSAPSVWKTHLLIACPHADFGPPCQMICNFPDGL